MARRASIAGPPPLREYSIQEDWIARTGGGVLSASAFSRSKQKGKKGKKKKASTPQQQRDEVSSTDNGQTYSAAALREAERYLGPLDEFDDDILGRHSERRRCRLRRKPAVGKAAADSKTCHVRFSCKFSQIEGCFEGGCFGGLSPWPARPPLRVLYGSCLDGCFMRRSRTNFLCIGVHAGHVYWMIRKLV